MYMMVDVFLIFSVSLQSSLLNKCLSLSCLAFVVYGLTLLTTAMEVDASKVSSCMRLESATVCNLTPRSRSPIFCVDL